MQDNIKSYAKINLFLHVIGKKNDGYHQIESFFYFPEIYDKIIIEESNETAINFSGKFGGLLSNHDINQNLVIKAYKLLKAEFSKIPNLKFTIIKNLPISSGIGGGSANAATVLNFINEKYRLEINKEKLTNKALKLGADVPSSIYSKPAFISGIGENIKLLDNFPELNILLINPLKAISTAEIFKKGFGNFSAPIDVSNVNYNNFDSLVNFLKNTKNDLQNSAVEICPEIEEIIQLIDSQKGCLLSRMSGSGATCFGIFETRKDLNLAFDILEKNYPNFWVSKNS